MGKSQSKQSIEAVDRTNIEEVCTAWAQKKYGPKCKVVSVDTKDVKVSEENIHYRESDKKERSSVTHRRKTFPNKTSTSMPREIKDQSATKYSCGWTRTKGYQVSGDLSVNVGLPAAVGLKLGGTFQHTRSNTKTEISGIDETSEQVTKFTQPSWSTWLTETVTTQRVVTMPYTQVLRLEGTLEITLQRANRKTKTELVDVVDLYPEEKVETDAGGKRSVRLTNEGMFEATTEMDQEVTVEELGPDELMRLKHNELLRDNREKIVEEVKDQRALSELMKVMSSEKVVSKKQVQTVFQSQSVTEGVDTIVDVLEKAEPEKFLVFVDILQREGYSELVELLDPRGMYPDSVRHISNRSGVVDHYFVTKKEREVKDSLESARGVILHGMPGSGKTQMAYKLAGDYAKVHPHSVVWVIDGSSEEKLKDGITNLRQRLGGETSVDISQFQSLVSRWKHSLLVINDLSPQVAIPTQVLSSSAKMIVTTQDSLMESEDIANIPIEGFTEDEAVKFLSKKMPRGTTEEQMIDFANLFSRLPLGLAAARASIHRGKMTVEEYKQQLQGGREALDVLMEREDNWLQKHYKEEHQEAAKNIFAALQLAIDKLDDPCNPEEEKKCKVMLQPCAFLAPNNIPVLILKSALESSPTIGADAHFTERMRMYSLGNIEGEGVKRHLSIHGVTQMAIRLHMDQQQQTTCVNKVLQILVKFFVKDMTYSEMHKFSVSLMPHVEAALKHADKLELGAEYPLMKARLLMVYGHLLIQKGTLRLSKIYLEEAKESLIQFADMLSVESVERNPDYRKIVQESYQLLTNKSQSLDDIFFEETVIKRVIAKHHFRAISDQIGAEHSTTRKLENMMENFEPLTREIYNTLVDNDLAIPVKKLKRIFLPELYISIMFTLSRAMLDLDFDHDMMDSITLALDMCTEVTKDIGVIVMVGYLADFISHCRVKVIHMVTSRLLYEAYVAPIVLKAVELLILHETKGKDAVTRSYDFGLLTGDDDTLLKLNYFENVMVCCIQALQQAEEDKKLRLISWGQDTCKKMLELVERESQAGNPPLRLPEYYMTAGLFSAVVEELEKAADMYWKAYRVELKREEYHPRMGEALRCLIEVRIKQSKLTCARVCARRFLQLAQDHWSYNVKKAKEIHRKVYYSLEIQNFFQTYNQHMHKKPTALNH